MCGIAGLFRPFGIDVDPIHEMTALLAHRGPDGEQIITVNGPDDRPIAALGARRLAIVDPEAGEQPVWDASRQVLVAFNGEIYNHRRLRQELQAQGVPFQSECDSEVIANLIAQVGLSTAVKRLHGMFAIAVLEPKHQRLTLIRDRMGVKPLYWTQTQDQTLVWASEVRALLSHPQVTSTPHQAALQSLLLFEYIPTPWTAWMGVHKLEPGCHLVFDLQGLKSNRWWTPPVPVAGKGGSLLRWSESLAAALQVATHQRMEADVDVGYLLSGGLDSSSIAAIAAHRSPRPIHTFSMAVDSPGFDESSAARDMANHIGAVHHESRMGPEDLLRVLPQIGQHMGEPLADSSLIPTWLLMKSVRDAGLKCVLSGDGADESLAGYPTYSAHQFANLATPFRQPLTTLSRRLPTQFEGVSRDYMIRRFADGLGRPWPRRHQVWMGAWLPEELLDLDASIWQPVDTHAHQAQSTDVVSKAMYLDQRLYLSDGVLVKVDRASMAHGVEVRSPFLDHTITELCASMPIGLKLKMGQTKRVLRAAMKDAIPQTTLQRKKKGFGAPIGPWLRGPCAHLLEGLSDSIADLVSPETMKRTIHEHQNGARDHRRRLWTAIVLREWRKHHTP